MHLSLPTLPLWNPQKGPPNGIPSVQVVSCLLFLNPVHIFSVCEWVPKALKELDGATLLAAGLRDVSKTWPSAPEGFWRSRGGAGWTQAGWIPTLLSWKPSSTMPGALYRRVEEKNKSRLSTHWGPRKNAGGFMHCAKEPSNPRRWPFTTCLNGTGPGMTLGKRLTHGPGKFHFLKDSFWDVIPSCHSSAQILPMAPYLLPVAYPILCETWLHPLILFFIPSALPHLPTCCPSNRTEMAPATGRLNFLFP